MSDRVVPARLRILPASDAPVAVVLRRKPAKQFHVLLWHTTSGKIEQGSWFRGNIRADWSDLSPDGQWFAYAALGAKGDEAWTGVCRPPKLTTVVHWDNPGFFPEGAFWADEKTLINLTNHHHVPALHPVDQITKRPLPFSIVTSKEAPSPRSKFHRDGWIASEKIPAEARDETDRKWYARVFEVPEVMELRREGSPTLFRWNREVRGKHRFGFALEGFGDFVGKDCDDVCWDSKGCLLVARAGVLERYSLADLEARTPSSQLDLNPLEKPVKTNRKR